MLLDGRQGGREKEGDYFLSKMKDEHILIKFYET